MKSSLQCKKGLLDLIAVVHVDDLNIRGVNYIASMIYDFCAQLYDKPSDEYKESEQLECHTTNINGNQPLQARKQVDAKESIEGKIIKP